MLIRRSQKKRNAEPAQKQNHRRLVIDPMVNPGSSAHRHQARPKADPTRPHHRMVTLAQSSPGDRPALAHQSKTTTVMLGKDGSKIELDQSETTMSDLAGTAAAHWIAVPLREQRPFLGICLGAQMLAMQLGAKVAPHPEGRAARSTWVRLVSMDRRSMSFAFSG